MTTKVYVGDVGTVITLGLASDISAATARSIEVLKPDGSALSWAAAASGTTAIAFTTLAGTIDMAGDWILQAKVTLPGGTWYGESARLTVSERFR